LGRVKKEIGKGGAKKKGAIVLFSKKKVTYEARKRKRVHLKIEQVPGPHKKAESGDIDEETGFAYFFRELIKGGKGATVLTIDEAS